MKSFIKRNGILAAVITLVAAIITLIAAFLQFRTPTSNPTTESAETSKIFKVNAQQGWQNTGINLKAGQKVTLHSKS